jgi:hypothetical protein
MKELTERSSSLSPQALVAEKAEKAGATRHHFGIWEAWVGPRSKQTWTAASLNPIGWITEQRQPLRYLVHFIREVFILSPVLCTTVFALETMDGYLPTIQMYTSNQLLFTVRHELPAC